MSRAELFHALTKMGLWGWRLEADKRRLCSRENQHYRAEALLLENPQA